MSIAQPLRMEGAILIAGKLRQSQYRRGDAGHGEIAYANGLS